jgi:hypothetical protein
MLRHSGGLTYGQFLLGEENCYVRIRPQESVLA